MLKSEYSRGLYDGIHCTEWIVEIPQSIQYIILHHNRHFTVEIDLKAVFHMYCTVYVIFTLDTPEAPVLCPYVPQSHSGPQKVTVQYKKMYHCEDPAVETIELCAFC